MQRWRSGAQLDRVPVGCLVCLGQRLAAWWLRAPWLELGACVRSSCQAGSLHRPRCRLSRAMLALAAGGDDSKLLQLEEEVREEVGRQGEGACTMPNSCAVVHRRQRLGARQAGCAAHSWTSHAGPSRTCPPPGRLDPPICRRSWKRERSRMQTWQPWWPLPSPAVCCSPARRRRAHQHSDTLPPFLALPSLPLSLPCLAIPLSFPHPSCLPPLPYPSIS